MLNHQTTGSGMKSIMQRQTQSSLNNMGFNTAFLRLEVDEFEEALREAGASEKMIAGEVAQFKELKAQREGIKERIEQRRDAKRNRPVEGPMSKYYSAIERRKKKQPLNPIDEVIEEIYGKKT